MGYSKESAREREWYALHLMASKPELGIDDVQAALRVVFKTGIRKRTFYKILRRVRARNMAHDQGIKLPPLESERPVTDPQKVLEYVLRHPWATNKDIAEKLGLSVRMVVYHLQRLRTCGRIVITKSRNRESTVIREITVVEPNAILEGQVSQQGSSQPRSGPSKGDPGNDEGVR